MQPLNSVYLDVAISLIVKQFVGKEEFLVFKYTDGKTNITNGNDITLATVKEKLFSQVVWAIYDK